VLRQNGGATDGLARKQTPEWRSAICDGMQGYVAEVREKNKDRNETIVRLYDSDLTFRQIAAEMKLSYFTVNRVLQSAKSEGLVEIRPPVHLRANRDKEQ